MGLCNTRQETFKGAFMPIAYASDYPVDNTIKSIKKVIVIGDETVGKSNIISRFVYDKFDCTYVQTMGSDFAIKIIKSHGEKTKFQIWDLTGSRRFNTMVSSYINHSHIVVIVYDKTNIKSFENLNYWLTMVADNIGTDHPQMVLVGNKSDLLGQIQVSTEMGRTFATNHGMHFVETSALTNMGIDDVFTKSAKK